MTASPQHQSVPAPSGRLARWRFRVGGAGFFDVGRVYGSKPEGCDELGVLRDVGIGLRLANTRSGMGRVIHIDLAHPLDGGADISKLQLLLSTEQSF